MQTDGVGEKIGQRGGGWELAGFDSIGDATKKGAGHRRGKVPWEFLKVNNFCGEYKRIGEENEKKHKKGANDFGSTQFAGS